MKKILSILCVVGVFCGAFAVRNNSIAQTTSYTTSYFNIENTTSAIDINPANINVGEQPPTSFIDENWGGGITTTVVGPAYSAGLSKRVVALPANVHQFTFSYQIRPSQTATIYAQVYETDLMIVDASGNRFNGSCQINNYEGGMWQIANASGGWVDTGFKPGLLPPDVWTQVSVVYLVNWQKLTLSVVSIEQGSQVFSGIAPALQNIPATQKSGWQPSILDVQIQDGMDSEPGGFSRDMRNITIQGQ